MQDLSRYNAILTGTYAMDNGYRVVAYAISLLSLFYLDPKSDTAKALGELRAKIGDARILNRFFIGTTASLAWFVSGSWDNVVDRLMSLSMVLYHPLEHGAFLSGLKLLPAWMDGNELSKWACRMWFLYVVCDAQANLKALGVVNKELEKNPSQVDAHRRRRNILLWLTCIAADFPLALQWSFDQGPFSDKLIAWAGFYGGIGGLYTKWLKAKDAEEKAKGQ